MQNRSKDCLFSSLHLRIVVVPFYTFLLVLCGFRLNLSSWFFVGCIWRATREVTYPRPGFLFFFFVWIDIIACFLQEIEFFLSGNAIHSIALEYVLILFGQFWVLDLLALKKERERSYILRKYILKMAAASSSAPFFGRVREEHQNQIIQQHSSTATSSTVPTTGPQKKRRNQPGTPSK